MKKVIVAISLAILFIVGVANNVTASVNYLQEMTTLGQYPNRLQNGSQPYKYYYGENSRYNDNTPHSEIKVIAPKNSDVIVIVKYGNKDGNVAGHIYISAGNAGVIKLRNNCYYQTFFYYGLNWDSQKLMANSVRGGFTKGEAFSKDGNPVYLYDNILTYELTITYDGNFSTTRSNEEEIF